MARVRALNEKKYGISKHAFRTAYSYCLQYDEWKQELETRKITGLQSPQLTGLPGVHSNSSRVEQQAISNAELETKITKIEETVKETIGQDRGLYKYLLEYVTTDGATFNWIKQRGMPCERTKFYELRRKFYCLLAQKI